MTWVEGMMDPVDDLLVWLRAQLDEDERLARAAAGDDDAHWSAGGEDAESVTGAERGGPVAAGPYDCPLPAGTRRHIAEHDPTRVLAEVDAKRRLLKTIKKLKRSTHTKESIRQDYRPGTWREYPTGPDPRKLLLKLLAMPYSDRPGYREEWRPA